MERTGRNGGKYGCDQNILHEEKKTKEIRIKEKIKTKGNRSIHRGERLIF